MLKNYFAFDIGSHSLKLTDSNGVLYEEPSMIVVNVFNEIVAYGSQALEMRGKIPPSFKVFNPITDGMISDYEGAVLLIRSFLKNTSVKKTLFKPGVIVNVPIDSTPVERESVYETLKECGFSKIGMVLTPVSSAIGSGIDISESKGNMVVNIGAEHTEIAIISLSTIVTKETISVAGNSANNALSMYFREKYEVLIGKNSIEQIKLELINISDEFTRKESMIIGIDLKTGLPKKVKINSNEIKNVVYPYFEEIFTSIRHNIEGMPPELIKDIMERGIIFCGGVSKTPGLTTEFFKKTSIRAVIPEEAEYCCLKGNLEVIKNPGYGKLIFSEN